MRTYKIEGILVNMFEEGDANLPGQIAEVYPWHDIDNYVIPVYNGSVDISGSAMFRSRYVREFVKAVLLAADISEGLWRPNSECLVK